jgi:AcrR family transcriptional regulator
MELYSERGFDSTTVAEIAERAGLTERTFFRYFADKREVLFYGSAALLETLVGGVEQAPTSLSPIEVILSALMQAATDIFEERRDFARRRQALISANADLQERELIKLATLASELAQALCRRGVTDPAASLAAEAGISVFKIAFQLWVDDSGEQTLAHLIRVSMDEMQEVAAGRRPTRRR